MFLGLKGRRGDGGLIDASLGDDVAYARALEAFVCKQIDSGLDNGVTSGFGRSDHSSSCQFKRSFEQLFIFRLPAKGKLCPREGRAKVSSSYLKRSFEFNLTV
jgi:hypothetical protein